MLVTRKNLGKNSDDINWRTIYVNTTFCVEKFSEKKMKITKKLIEEMVKEELTSIKEDGMSYAGGWSLSRQLASLVRLVGSNPGRDASAHRAAMDIINSMIAEHGTDDDSAPLVGMPQD